MTSHPISGADLGARLPNLPDWSRFISQNSSEWTAAVRRAQQGGPRILLATVVGGGTSSALAAFESLLAVALTLRGANVTVLLCDQALPACMNLEVLTFPDLAAVADNRFNRTTACAECALTGRLIFEPLGLSLRRLSDYLGTVDHWEMRARRGLPAAMVTAFQSRRAAVEEHAHAGALRYLARGSLEEVAGGSGVLDAYRESAMLTQRIMKRALAELKPEACVSSHGLYTPYGVVGDICRSRGVRYSAWNVAYRKQCFIFSHGDTYHHTLLDEPVSAWEDMPWSEEREKQVRDYLASRISGTHDWIWFFEKPENDVSAMFSRLGLDRRKPMVLLLTNVLWDAQLHYRANAYASMIDWVVDTVDCFKRRPDLQLLIRVHPAEMRATLPSRQRVADELAKVFPELPPNVFLVGPGEQVSTYALAECCDSAVIYGTKTGVELACMGIPVIVAGEAWVRGKGITHDATSRASYHELLGSLPLGRRLAPEVRLRAYKYAYHFFFRRMIPVTAAEPVLAGWPPFRVVPGSLAALQPGADPGLDLICEGILQAREYVFDEPVSGGDSHHLP